MKYGKIVNGAIEYAPTRHGGLLTDGGLILNPKASDYNDNGYYEVQTIAEDGEDTIEDGVLKHYVGAPITEEYTPTYEERVVQYIREKYSIDEELAILRQRDTKTDEYNEYFEYCETCKAKAKAEEGE